MPDRQTIGSSDAGTNASWRGDVEGLRGLAVLAILVYHAIPSALPGGFVGVDVFFVVSGFVVGKILVAELSSGRFTYGRFYARRIRRIVPALIVVLCGTFLAAQFLVGVDDLRLLSQQIGATSVFAANLLAWSQSGYFDSDAAYKPLLHLWSLGVEEQYYALLPAGFVAVWKKWPRHVYQILMSATIVSLLFCIAVTASDGNAAFYLPITRFWELLCGMLLAWREFRSDGLSSQPEGASLIGGAVLLGSFLFLSESQLFPGWLAVMPVVGTMLVIAGGAECTINRTFLQSRPLTLLGQISYPAYLWHWPMLVLARFWSGGELSSAGSIAITLLSLPMAWISTRFIEAPFRSGRWSREEELPKILVAALLLVGGLALLRPAFPPSDVSSPALARLEAYPNSQGDLWREEEGCFIALNEEKDFGSVCLGAGDLRMPLVGLWGDSLAAHLWPGFRDSANARGWRLAQLTVSQCPPILSGGDEGNGKCSEMRNRALEAIGRIQPKVLVLAGGWTRYGEETLAKEIGPTIARFKEAGVGRVVVLGPVPIWRPTLAKALASDMRKMRLEEAPLYTVTGFRTEVFGLDEKLKSLTEREGGVYVSALSVLCKEQKKCRVWVDEDKRTVLTTYDSGHFSIEQSRWFAEQISGLVLFLDR